MKDTTQTGGDMLTSARAAQLHQWIQEAETALRDGITITDEWGEPISVASTRECLAMWRDELGEDEGPGPMLGEVDSDFPTIFAH